MSVTRNINSISTLAIEEGNEPIYDSSIILSTDIDYEIQNRTLIPINVITDIAVQGDSNSQFVGITVDRFFDGIDLSTKTIQVAYENASGETGVYTVEHYNLFADKINLFWILDSHVTAEQGEIHFQVRFITYSPENNNVYTYLWQSKIQSFVILPQIDVLDYAIPKDFSKEQQFIEDNPDAVYFNITDEDVPIDIEKRQIGVVPREIVVRGDSLSQVLSFRLPLDIEGVKVMSKIITIKYLNAYGEGDRTRAINVIEHAAEGYVSFGWLIDSKATSVSGKLQFAIELLGWWDKEENQFYSWQTKVSQIEVLNSIEITDDMMDITPQLYTQWGIESNKKLQIIEELENTTRGLKQRAEEFAADSENSATHALISEQNAKISEENAKASENHSIALEQSVIEHEAIVLNYRNETEQLRDDARASQEAAALSETNAKISETNAKASEEKTKTSETNAKTSETNAKTSETNAAMDRAQAAAEAQSAMVSKTEAEKAEIEAKEAQRLAGIANTQAQTAMNRAETVQSNLEGALEEIETIRNTLITVEEF